MARSPVSTVLPTPLNTAARRLLQSSELSDADHRHMFVIAMMVAGGLIFVATCCIVVPVALRACQQKNVVETPVAGRDSRSGWFTSRELSLGSIPPLSPSILPPLSPAIGVVLSSTEEKKTEGPSRLQPSAELDKDMAHIRAIL